MISVEKITTGYYDTKVLDRFSITFRQGEFCALAGPNGAGKSTLLKAIIGFQPLWEGEIKINGKKIEGMQRREIARLLTIIPQEVQIQFDYSVKEIVLMGRFPYLNFWQKYSAEDMVITDKILNELGLSGLRDKHYSELSGGEKQRVHIGRALAQDTAAILLDESLVHLDINHQLEIINLLQRINKKSNKLIILVSHNLNLAADYCERIILIKDGTDLYDGSPAEVITDKIIKSVYGVELNICNNPYTGNPNILYPGTRG
jgi:iron complex transport system ATP-binding protein